MSPFYRTKDGFPAWDNVFQQIIDLSDRIRTTDAYGPLHIVVADGNMEDEHIEFCLGLKLTEEERQLANDLLWSEYEIRCFSYWLSNHDDVWDRLGDMCTL